MVLVDFRSHAVCVTISLLLSTFRSLALSCNPCFGCNRYEFLVRRLKNHSILKGQLIRRLLRPVGKLKLKLHLFCVVLVLIGVWFQNEEVLGVHAAVGTAQGEYDG